MQLLCFNLTFFYTSNFWFTSPTYGILLIYTCSGSLDFLNLEFSVICSNYVLTIYMSYYDCGLFFIVAKDFFICKDYIYQLFEYPLLKIKSIIMFTDSFSKIFFGLTSLSLFWLPRYQPDLSVYYSFCELSSALPLLKFNISKSTTVI